MKRTIKIAAVAFIAAMGILVAYNATSDTEMNDLQNENLEALAGGDKKVRTEILENPRPKFVVSKGDCKEKNGDCSAL